MLLCTEDDDREWIKRRRETCLENVKRPPVKVEEFGDLHKAVTETQHRMGIAQPNGNAFRLNGGKRQGRPPEEIILWLAVSGISGQVRARVAPNR